MRGIARAALGMVAVFLLTGCERALTPEEQARRDTHDIAMVERANDTLPPIEQLTPEPLLAPDIERYDLAGAACNYAPGTSFGARVIARAADAFMKVDGEMLRFAADPGSRELPQHTRSLYNGRKHVLRLQIEGGEGEAPPEGSVMVFDQYGRVVYAGVGLVQCRG